MNVIFSVHGSVSIPSAEAERLQESAGDLLISIWFNRGKKRGSSIAGLSAHVR